MVAPMAPTAAAMLYALAQFSCPDGIGGEKADAEGIVEATENDDGCSSARVETIVSSARLLLVKGGVKRPYTGEETSSCVSRGRSPLPSLAPSSRSCSS